MQRDEVNEYIAVLLKLKVLKSMQRGEVDGSIIWKCASAETRNCWLEEWGSGTDRVQQAARLV